MIASRQERSNLAAAVVAVERKVAAARLAANRCRLSAFAERLQEHLGGGKLESPLAAELFARKEVTHS